MTDVSELDTIQAQELLASVFGAEHARSATNVQAVARFMATHRQAAEKAQQERDAGIADDYAAKAWGMTEEGHAAEQIATAIRSQGHE